MAESLGAPPAAPGDLPDISMLHAEAVDAEAGAWRLPAVAVRAGRAPTPPLPSHGRPDVAGATVVVLGTAWAVPLAGHALAGLGARVVRVDNPRRPDPFPLRDALAAGCEQTALDLDDPAGHAAFRALLSSADLVINGSTPRVLANVGLDDAGLRSVNPELAALQVTAFTDEDRPGYGFAAECRGGWAVRHDPPRLARTSVADPVAGLLAAIVAVDLLGQRRAGSRADVTLEHGVGLLLAEEAA
jgi:crotonobetainyl-CoA:carnitine CoA-transferase CaiB-like acyl-CoA transferase